MFQSLLRSWLTRTAHQKMRQAATEALRREPAPDPRTASEQGPPDASLPRAHVGCVFALGIEAAGLVDRLQGVVDTVGAGFVAREGGLAGKRVMVFESRVGCEAATAATQALIAGHRPRWVISTGFAGGLDPRLVKGDILMADQIVDVAGRRFDIDFKIAPGSPTKGVHVGRLVTLEKILRERSEKEALAHSSGAMAIDMETIAVAQVCRDEKVRFLSIRVISDTFEQTLPPDIEYLMTRRGKASQWGAAAGTIFRRPKSIKELWQLKEDAIMASERLAKFLVGVIGQLGE